MNKAILSLTALLSCTSQGSDTAEHQLSEVPYPAEALGTQNL